MLTLEIPALELWNPETELWTYTKPVVLELEHSLISISKWEEKWAVPFWGDQEKTPEQVLDYIRCMTITRNVNPAIYLGLTEDHLSAVNDYLHAPMTATVVRDMPTNKRASQFVTSELVYSWMISLSIPFECRTWHINRLLMLIRVCSEQNKTSKPAKRSRSQILAENRRINAQNKALYGTRG